MLANFLDKTQTLVLVIRVHFQSSFVGLQPKFASLLCQAHTSIKADALYL